MSVRDRLLEKLGRIPSPAGPHAPAIDRRFTREGIGMERWRLRGPRDEISALFLIAPETPRPAPAVLAIHPHGRQYETGKSLVADLVGDGTRAYALAAARAGFAVLAPDMPGFEDRRPPIAERKSNYALQGEGYERTLAMQALVQGGTLQGWILADLSACVDALSADPRVDGARIACAGQSFGGQETIFGMLWEPRLRAGIASCGFSLVRLLVERNISHNFALYLPGMLPDLDFDVLVPALAPRPLFVIAGALDPLFPVEGVREVESRARAAYASAGAGGSLHFHYAAGAHDLPPDALALALAWLRKALAPG